MPGLNQLKQFNSDLLNLGDEVKIRSARGEKPSLVPIPKNVEDRDDSEDFKNGMPQISEDEQAQAEAAREEAERAKNDFSDITGDSEEEELPEEEAPVATPAPDVSNLLGPADITIDDIDLSDFEEPAAPPPKKEIPIEDQDLDDLLGLKEEPVADSTIEEVLNYRKPEADSASQTPPNMAETVDVDIDKLMSDDVEDIEEIEEVEEAEELPEMEELSDAKPASDSSVDDVFAQDDLIGGLDSLGDEPASSPEASFGADDFADLDASLNSDIFASSEASPGSGTDDFSVPDFSMDSEAFGDSDVSSGLDLSSEPETTPQESFAAEEPVSSEEPLAEQSVESPLSGADSTDFNFDDFAEGPGSFDLGSEDSLGLSENLEDDLGKMELNEPEVNETPEADLSDAQTLDSEISESDGINLDMPESDFTSEPDSISTENSIPESDDFGEEPMAPNEALVNNGFADPEINTDSFDMPDLPDMSEMSESAESTESPEEFSDTSDFTEPSVSSDFPEPEVSEDSAAESSEESSFESPDSVDTNIPADVLNLGDFNPDEEAGNNTDSFDLPDNIDFTNDENSDALADSSDTPADSDAGESGNQEFSMDDFGMPDDSLPSDTEASFEVPGETSDAGFDIGSESAEGAGESIIEEGESESGDGEGSAGGFSFDLPDMDSSGGSGFSLPDFDMDAPLVPGEGISPDMEVPDFNDEETVETYDTSDIDDFDFSADEQTDFELGNITTQEADEDDLFSIPGFSDTVTADLNKNRAPDVQSPDFAEALEDESGRVKNTFTDNEYKRFQQNLETYPLNIRIAIEDLVVKNEFTDDAVFSILEKVFRKAPARQIATELEKMLDVSLDVPRDFERRTAAEYEAYKKSLEYQLRNRILPAAILTTGAAIFAACLFLLVRTFIVFPVKASNLYNQGYTLLENNQYDQALDCFNEAVVYKDVKEWYYKYAKGFREKKQYDRATSMYKAILAYFDHEKRAGMEWAEMESQDLYNYEETERILKREVLDYHINDLDAITMLGDLYLDWATEKDSTKFPMAKAEYDLLLELGSSSNQNKYLSRQMRYYIRTDNLRQVLGYKEYFFDIKGKNGLGASDLTELSGYLLDKLYGTLTPAEESLRFNIENVRELLERAIEADPSNPVALYNMGRYFVQTENRSAVSLLKTSLDKFDAQTRRTRSETYKYINCYRLLGEEYRDQREYFRAEEIYGNGITLFEKENDESGFVSDTNVGKLYADMADLDYFIFGDMDHALTNYENAVVNKNDTSSIRYRIGYIQYKNDNFESALTSFIRSSEVSSTDTHLLLALGNTLYIRGDNYASQGYYERLLELLNSERELHDVILPQVRSDQADLVDVYMKASNNLGVTYSKLASATGNSSLNGKSLTCLQESIRAWDAMTRNQDTMVRLEGSNLAEQNVKYITNSATAFDPAIYTDIFKLMDDEEGLQ